MLSLLALLRLLLDKIQRVINCSARLIFKVPKSAHITPFLYDLHWLPISGRIQYKMALICYKINFSSSRSSTSLFLVQPLHTSLSYFISTLLALFAQPRIFAASVFLGWAGGPWGRDPFNTLDLCSGTPVLSLAGIRFHSLLLGQS